MNFEYKQVFLSESAGSSGCFGLKILFASDRAVDFKEGKVAQVLFDSAEAIIRGVEDQVLSNDPATAALAAKDRSELVGCFEGPIFVEETRNEYSNSVYSRHLPWFVVTTVVGRFKIGWRKRVIHLEWTDTIVNKTAEELFPQEDTTKSGRVIHAWSYEKAKEYIRRIVECDKESTVTAAPAASE